MSILGIPFLVSRLVPLEIKSTPKAAEFAAGELDKMGPLNLPQKIVLAVFLLVCGLWLTASLHGLSIAVVAMGGACVLFLSGVLTWEDAITERTAWDVFVWYGGVGAAGRGAERLWRHRGFREVGGPVTYRASGGCCCWPRVC